MFTTNATLEPRRIATALSVVAVCLATVIAPVALEGTPASAAPPTSDGTTFAVGTPSLVSMSDNGSLQAPWDNWQGDSEASPCTYSQLFPTYDPGATGCPTTTDTNADVLNEPVTSPNFSVYPGASSGTDGDAPYPDGSVGTPGPLDDYCGSGDAGAETSPISTPSRQPTGEVLPMAPYYFPHIVRNVDGSLTGYFDYRPKDADEAIVTARSTDNGKDWTYEGEALEQDHRYCPSADNNDDGEGHPNVLTIGSNSYLYTLQRAGGDYPGVGLMVHPVNPNAANPLSGVSTTEQVGTDPDSPATAAATIIHGTASVINVGATDSSYLVNGAPTSPEELVPGPFVDLTQTPYATAANVITCTGVTATSLTGCTTPSGTTINVSSGDLIEQVLAKVVSVSGSMQRLQAGPNTTTGDGGTGTLTVTPTSTFTSSIINANAPNRLYTADDAAGQTTDLAIYCSQSNTSGTKLEDCTTGPGGTQFATLSPVSADPQVGTPILSDPIVPQTAQQTSGLISPDGIVGVLPTYPGAPTGSTIVMYTEKELNYFVTGTTTNSTAVAFSSSTPTTIAFNPSTYESVDLPATISPSQPVTLEMGATNTAVGGTPTAPNVGSIIPVTCTGLTNVNGTPGTAAVDSFAGCTVPSADNGMTYSPTAMIGTAAAATVPEATLALTGEGSTKSTAAAKLWKNNEDLEILRVAYTYDGITFSSTGLANGGVISGASNGDSSSFNPSAPSSDNYTGSQYTDLTNPEQTTSPSNLNAYGAAGTTDASEMRWIGSTGTIITNPDGSIGLFINGAFAADGDSDAFNQVFYSSSTDGQNWTPPVSVVSTDYTFQASINQEANPSSSLGISAYYSGRAYNPTVVPNSDGTLTMLFSGYRTPSNETAGSPGLGTGSSTYSPGPNDPNLYRTILETTLTPISTSPGGTSTTVTSNPAVPVVGQSVSYTASVSSTASGTILPTGTVTFSDANGTLCGGAVTLNPADTATCTTTFDGNAVAASYSSDANYAASNGSLDFAPGAPGSVTASPGSGIAVVGWSPPATTGGSSVTGYSVTDGQGDSCVAGGSADSCEIEGLDNGTSYTFTATATNAVGTSVASTGVTVTPGATEQAFPTSGTVSVAGSDGFTDQLDTVNEISPITYVTSTSAPGISVSPSGGISVTSTLPAGSYSVVGESSDDYGDSAPWNYTLTVNQQTPSTPMISDLPGSGTYGGDFDATVATTGDGATSVTTSTPSVCTVSGSVVTYVGEGSCTLDAHVAAGTDYSGADGPDQSVTVTQADSTTAITSTTASPVVGQPISIGVSVGAVAPGGPAVPTGTVTVSDGLLNTCTATLDGSGNGSCSITEPMTGPTAFTATYSGDGNYNPSSTIGGTSVTVNPETPSTPMISDLPGSGTYGGDFDATVATTGDGATSVTTSTPSVCTVSGSVVTYVGEGSCTLDAHVAAGTDYSGADGPDQSVTVTQADSTTAITSTTASPVVGQPISIGVSVGAVAPGGPAVPTGTVTVSDGLLNTCTATLDGSGNGSCSITEPMTGPTVFTATYSGDGNYNPSSTGAGTSVTVGPGDPGVPTGVTAVPGNGQATVSWTAPSDDGGSPITSYSIGVTPTGGPTVTYVDSSGVLHVQGDSVQTTFGGLTNGVSYTFTVAATTTGGTSAASDASAAVAPSAQDALVTSSDVGAFVPGRSFSIPLTATGPTAPTKASAAWFSAVGLPAGVTIVPATGKKADTAAIEGTAQYAGGALSVLVSASNAPGTETTQLVNIYPLTWTSLPTAVTLVAGSPGSFTGTVSDPDATVTHSTLPAGCVATATGSMAVTNCLPTSGRAKPYPVKFTATDGKLKVTATVEITIDQAPALTATPSSVTVTAGKAVSVALATTGFPAPTVTLTGAPSWLTVTSKKLTGTTPTGGGSWTFTVNASNGVGTEASQTITITATT